MISTGCLWLSLSDILLGIGKIVYLLVRFYVCRGFLFLVCKRSSGLECGIGGGGIICVWGWLKFGFISLKKKISVTIVEVFVFSERERSERRNEVSYERRDWRLSWIERDCCAL